MCRPTLCAWGMPAAKGAPQDSADRLSVPPPVMEPASLPVMEKRGATAMSATLRGSTLRPPSDVTMTTLNRPAGAVVGTTKDSVVALSRPGVAEASTAPDALRSWMLLASEMKAPVMLTPAPGSARLVEMLVKEGVDDQE